MLSTSCRRQTAPSVGRWKISRTRRPAVVLAAQQLDFRVENLRQHLHDGQAQAAAGAALVAIQAVEAGEDFVALVLGDAGAIVFDLDDDVLILAEHAHDHVAAVTVVAHGVVDQIAQQLGEQHLVAMSYERLATFDR